MKIIRILILVLSLSIVAAVTTQFIVKASNKASVSYSADNDKKNDSDKKKKNDSCNAKSKKSDNCCKKESSDCCKNSKTTDCSTNCVHENTTTTNTESKCCKSKDLRE